MMILDSIPTYHINAVELADTPVRRQDSPTAKTASTIRYHYHDTATPNPSVKACKVRFILIDISYLFYLYFFYFIFRVAWASWRSDVSLEDDFNPHIEYLKSFTSPSYRHLNRYVATSEPTELGCGNS